MSVQLDAGDCLLNYAFNKITCSRNIGAENTYRNFCCGKTVQDILNIEFPDLIETLNLIDTEEQFLVYLEWDALRSALCQYSGQVEGVETERYRIASVEYSETGEAEINLVIHPPEELPKIESCHSRARKESRL